MEREALTNDLLPFLARVGVGPRGGKTLTYKDAYTAMRVILERRFHPATLGAFSMALRFRGETAEELAGFLDAIHDTLVFSMESPPLSPLLDVAGAYDGKVRTLHLSLAASLLVAGAGIPVIHHGSEGIPTKFGIGPGHVLRALGIKTSERIEEVIADLQEIGIGYLHQPFFHPLLYRLTELRIAMGKRGFINTVEPLINPLKAPYHVSGFFHEPYGPLCAEAIRRSQHGAKSAILLTGVEGSDELRPTRGYLLRVTPEGVERVEVDLLSLGVPASPRDLDPPGEPSSKGEGEMKKVRSPEGLSELSARKIESFLAGERSGYGDLVLLSAGVRFLAVRAVSSLREGVELAREIWQRGLGRIVLEKWQERRPQTGAKTPAIGVAHGK
jgi:anthranilate phosphoribosyltransferase